MSKKLLEESVGKELLAQGLTIACAESCTGGLLTSRLTDIAGSSAYVMGSVVSYTNRIKESLVGVRHETLLSHGAVSEETAREMASGALSRLESDVAVSTTGIAGPTGGTDEKPVGTVCFAVASRLGVRSFTEHFGEELSREAIRRLASDFALSLVAGECERLG